jgi:hypothetical protein
MVTGNNEAFADPAGAGEPPEPAYAYRPSLLGAGWAFRLTADGIAWEAGAKSGRIPYRAVRRVRMTYKPVSMQSHRFVTEIWAEHAPKLQIISSSWKNLVEQERLDAPYAAFVRELHQRLHEAGAPVDYVQGRNPLSYWPGLALFVAVALGLAAAVVRALQVHALGGAVVVAGFLALFLWQGGNFFRRNRPGRYSPQALPAELIPKG